jgi:hypothetical protein
MKMEDFSLIDDILDAKVPLISSLEGQEEIQRLRDLRASAAHYQEIWSLPIPSLFLQGNRKNWEAFGNWIQHTGSVLELYKREIGWDIKCQETQPDIDVLKEKFWKTYNQYQSIRETWRNYKCWCILPLCITTTKNQPHQKGGVQKKKGKSKALLLNETQQKGIVRNMRQPIHAFTKSLLEFTSDLLEFLQNHHENPMVGELIDPVERLGDLFSKLPDQINK